MIQKKIWILLVIVTVSIFGKITDIDNIVNIPFTDSGSLDVRIVRIHHINNDTRITIKFPVRDTTWWWTGGSRALTLNGDNFKYFYLNGTKYTYDTSSGRKIYTGNASHVEFIFPRIYTSQFDLYECQSNFWDTCFNTQGATSGISDADKDNDGIRDSLEVANKLDPLDASDAQTDLDHDGFSNAIEISIGTNIRNAKSKPIWAPIMMDDIITFVPAKK